MNKFTQIITVIIVFLSNGLRSNGEGQYFISYSNFMQVSKMPAFVDKSLTLEHLFHEPQMKMITAPRRFGKSTNLNMIKSFVSIPLNDADANQRLATFKRLKVNRKYPDFVANNFGKYPVLYVDYKFIGRVRNYDNAIKILAHKVHNSYLEHRYLRNSIMLEDGERETCRLWCGDRSYRKMEEIDVSFGLESLARFLYKHYNNTQVFLLIDEYDAIITDAMMGATETHLEDIIELCTNQILQLVKSNEHVGRAVITGISCIAGSSLSGFNNIKEYRFLDNHPYFDFYGFIITEVQYLFTNLNVSKILAAEATEWYDGYICKKGHRIFCPFSILNFLQDGMIDNYWTASGRLESIRHAFAYPSIKECITKMIRNESIDVELVTDISIHEISLLSRINKGDRIKQSVDIECLFFSFLFEQGYLTFTGPKKPNHMSIPNLEIKTVFSSKLRVSVAEKYNIDNSQLGKCAAFFDNLDYEMNSTDAGFINNVKEYQADLQKVFLQFIKETNGYIIRNEAMFEHDLFVVLFCCNNFHSPESQHYSRYENNKLVNKSPRLGLYMIKKDIGVIIELNHSREKPPNSALALHHILDRQYYSVFEDEKYTPQPVKYYLFAGFSINNTRSVSVSFLVNTKNETLAVTLP